MKLNCGNCSEPLTKDLYQTRKLKYKENRDYFDIEDYSIEANIIDGSFIKWKDKRERTSLKKQILLNKDSYIGRLPEFNSGMGCCNLWREPVYCKCGNHIGYANLDCHIYLKCIHIYENSVRRVYK